MAAVLVLNTPDDGRLRPKHVEWPCRNKTCTVLHQVGVSFDLCSLYVTLCNENSCADAQISITIRIQTFRNVFIKIPEPVRPYLYIKNTMWIFLRVTHFAVRSNAGGMT